MQHKNAVKVTNCTLAHGFKLELSEISFAHNAMSGQLDLSVPPQKISDDLAEKYINALMALASDINENIGKLTTLRQSLISNTRSVLNSNIDKFSQGQLPYVNDLRQIPETRHHAPVISKFDQLVNDANSLIQNAPAKFKVVVPQCFNSSAAEPALSFRNHDNDLPFEFSLSWEQKMTRTFMSPIR